MRHPPVADVQKWIQSRGIYQGILEFAAPFLFAYTSPGGFPALTHGRNGKQDMILIPCVRQIYETQAVRHKQSPYACKTPRRIATRFPCLALA